MNLGVRALRLMLLGMLTLGALLGGALAALAPAAAQLPAATTDLMLTLRIDDEDGVVAPGQEFNVIAELSWPGSRNAEDAQLKISSGTLRMGGTLDWEDGNGRHLTVSETDITPTDLIDYEYLQVTGADGEPLPWVSTSSSSDPTRRGRRFGRWTGAPRWRAPTSPRAWRGSTSSISGTIARSPRSISPRGR